MENLNNLIFVCGSSNNSVISDFSSFFETEEKDSQVLVSEYLYNKYAALEEAETILRVIQSEWSAIQNVALYEIVIPLEDIFDSRKVLNCHFILIRSALKLCSSSSRKQRYISDILSNFSNLTNCIVGLGNLEEEFLLKLTTSKNVNSPVHQYLHTFLEMYYHIFCIKYICEVDQTEFEKIISIIMKNLMIISRTVYNRIKSPEHLNICDCTRNMWVILHIFCKKIGDGELFWQVFNKVMKDEESMFALGMLRDVSSLQQFHVNSEDDTVNVDVRPNYIFFIDRLKTSLLEADSAKLEKLLFLIEPLLSNVWLKYANVEAYQILWDYNSKRLNISNKNMTTLDALKINDILERITLNLECDENFIMFVKLLITHLRQHPYHWSKMKGRIYSQLGPNKVKELTDVGITHVMILFIALTYINHDELMKKILSFMNSLSKDKFLPLIWNLYSAFIIREVNRGFSLEKVAAPIVKMLNEASCDSKNFKFIKDFVSNFEHIIKISTNLEGYQWLLIDFWLGKYMNTCYLNDLQNVLDVILFTLKKVCSVDCWVFWEPVFKDHVYPVLKTLSTQHNAANIVGIIAGELCLVIPQMSMEIFTFFNGDNMPPQVCAQFLKVVLRDYPASFMLTQYQEHLVVQSWVKVCFLAVDQSDDLTQLVLKLDCFPELLRAHILKSEDAVYAFIEYLGSDINNHIKSTSINKLCDYCFGNADKWIAHYLISPNQESLVHRIYTCISLAFLHCGPLLYSRSKSSSPLTKIIQTMLLSTDFLIGKPLHPFILNAVKRTWHLFFEAVVRLNTDSDMFLERTLRDMITKYMQHLPTVDSPIIKCIEKDHHVAAVVLEKINNSYLKHPVKESDANLVKVLKLLGDVANSTSSVDLMHLIVTKTLYGLFEIIIFHAQRNTAINVIRIITASCLYPQIRSDFRGIVINATEKHMAFNTINYFQLTYILVKFIPLDIKDLLPQIKQQIVNVERLRGVGFDKSIRLQLEKLENMLKE